MVLELALVTTKPHIDTVRCDVSDNYAAMFSRKYSELFYDDWQLLCRTLTMVAMTEFDITMDKGWALWIKNDDANTCVYVDNCVSFIDYKLIRKS